MHLRSSEDLEWQNVKKAVKQRDHSCRCCMCMTAAEKQKQSKYATMLQPTDCAHSAYATFSTHPDTRYNPDHIFLLCRSCHSSIDSHHSPVDGSLIKGGMNEEWYWWWRIKCCKNEEYDASKDYKQMYLDGQDYNKASQFNSIDDFVKAFL